MKLRSLLPLLLLLIALPAAATRVTLFQIVPGGFTPCTGCNPVSPSGANAYFRLNVLNDNGGTAGPGTFSIYADGAVLAGSLPWPSPTLTYNLHLPTGRHSTRIEYVPNAGTTTETAASAELLSITWGDPGGPQTATTVSALNNPSEYSATNALLAQVNGLPGNPVAGGQVQFYVDGVTYSGLQTVSSTGQVALNVSSFSLGDHTFRASYTPDAAHVGGDSLSELSTLTVVPITTSTAVVSSLNPSNVGASVTFTATVTAGQLGNPGGSVVFVVDGVSQPAVGLGVTTQATWTQSFATPGTHSVTANYSGSAAATASSGTLAGGQVVRTVPTVALVSSANPSAFGQTVTFTASVSGSGATPTGTVQFKIDGGSYGAPQALDGTGHASIDMAADVLTIGLHPIEASYSGDGNYTSGAPGFIAGAQLVNPASTTTALTSNANPATPGATVTFTATVTSAFPGTPGGVVNFSIDGAASGSAGLNSAGLATYSSATLAPGMHTIEAAFEGSGQYLDSSATALIQAVNLAASSTTLTSSVNPSASGQSVTFTANIGSSYPGTPSGNVVFTVDGTPSAPIGLKGVPQATFSTAALTPGLHSVSAAYSGDLTYASSASGMLAQSVGTAASTTSLTSPANPSPAGQSVTFTAAVTSTLAGTPDGSVIFTVDGAASAPVALDGSAHASFATATLSPGSHTIGASYSGNATYAASASLPLTQGVDTAATTTTLAASSNSSDAGQAVTFTASVASTYAGTPTGSIVFSIDGTLTSPVALDGSAQATYTTSSLTPGNHGVSAEYAGDATYAASSSFLLPHGVGTAATSTTLTSSANPSAPGAAVTLTAAITSSVGGTPTGQVIFTVDGVAAAPVTLDGSAQATFTTAPLAPGTHPITATYGGDATYSGSISMPLTQGVGLAWSSVTVVATPNAALAGEPVTFTATVTSPFPGTLDGSVVFVIDGVSSASVPVDASGQAALTRTLGPGSHTVVATYSGNGTFVSASSDAVVVAVAVGAVAEAVAVPVDGRAWLFGLVGFLALAACWRKRQGVRTQSSRDEYS